MNEALAEQKQTMIQFNNAQINKWLVKQNKQEEPEKSIFQFKKYTKMIAY